MANKYTVLYKSIKLEVKRKRICLGCLKEFISNWAGNRKCRYCKVLEKRCGLQHYADADHQVNFKK